MGSFQTLNLVTMIRITPPNRISPQEAPPSVKIAVEHTAK